MLRNLDFLTKDLIAGFSYSNVNEPRECELRKVFDGIEYTAKVNYTASAVGGFLYRVKDAETNEYVYVLFAAYATQKSDEEVDEDTLVQQAKEKAMVKPDILMKFDEEPAEDDVETICMACLPYTKMSIKK